jgi:two-component system, cell cycle sensor histidine kinase and response regulator CckA
MIMTETSSDNKGLILIVDDTLSNLRLLSIMLTSNGYRVVEAADGASALSKACSQTPDMILLDIRMPGMDGYEVCQHLKADQATSNIPVIFVSALDEQTEKVQGFAVGGVDYITKPFQVKEVLARLETHLTVRRLQRQREAQNTQLQQEISDRIRAEQALQAAMEVLEARVEERTAELAAANLSLNAELQERKRGEAERERLLVQVRKQAQQVREIMNTVPEGVVLLDAEGQIIMANPVAQGHLLALANANVGDHLTHLGDQMISQLLAAPPKGLWHEVQNDSRSYEVIARPMTEEAEPQRWVMVVREVTREREIQRRMQQQDRLAAVGQMAAGIAHDFNNILAVILLYSEMVVNLPDLSQRVRERMLIIAQQCRRASELIQQILDFSRKSVLERQPMDLLPFLKEQVKMLERTLPENIKISLEAEPDQYIVEADPTRMQQAIMNLAVNARDAMPDGGNLKIHAHAIKGETDFHCVTCGQVTEGEWICIAVQDSGGGILPKDLPYIFEPFYTTKEPGKGTGLGLAQVYGIAKSHDGHVNVSSTYEVGSSFAIYLPAIPSQRPKFPNTEPFMLIRGAGETLLVVEDEMATRQALKDGLTLINYHVIAAMNGVQALSYLEEHPQEVRLVLSDVVMPEMGGIELLRAVRAHGLQIPVILMTGHPLQEEISGLQDLGLTAWMQKPPRLKQLSQIIAQALT